MIGEGFNTINFYVHPREEAVSVGPNHETPPVCLSCLRLVR